LRPSQEGRQEPGLLTVWSLRTSITGYSVGPLAGPPSTAPPGVRNGGAGTSRPRTLLSFEGASPAGVNLATRLFLTPNRPARPARRPVRTEGREP
jgi:hypothetical protein